MPSNGKTPTAGRTEIEQHKLLFDPENARLKERVRDHDGAVSQPELLEILWREFAVDEVAMSIAANGYFAHEPLFVSRGPQGPVVVEGNRRLAAVRLLLDAKLRRQVGATGLPTLSAAARKKLQRLPVIECRREDAWQYIGFKHVNGPQPWLPLAKAEYIAWVHNTLATSLEHIARQIGDQHATVKRLYRALMALEQAEAQKVYNRRDRWATHFSFSHLYTGLDYGNIQKFTGIAGERSYRKRPIPKKKVKEFGQFCEWLYGSKSKNKRPVLRTQNPDLRILDEVLGSKDAIAALRRGLPLEISLDISKGDELLLRESLVEAKRSLQDARGKLLTGYEGESDLLASAEDIRALAIDIHQQ